MQARRVYRAHLPHSADEKNGLMPFCHYGHVSSCGEWVEAGETRWRLSPQWKDSEAEARAVLAPEIARIGFKLIEQAAELLRRTDEEKATPTERVEA
jgi:hypothetical protein